jgi:23S rRNA (adenine2503-C2)-methyltransferase
MNEPKSKNLDEAMLLLKNMPSSELATSLEDLGVRPEVARRMQVFAVKQGLDQLPERVDGIGRVLWQRILDSVEIPHLKTIEKIVSPYDGFTKYLFQGEGPEHFEAVRIPLLHRPGDEKYVICVSSQVGCSAKCAFCATGRMGFRRNLSTWEIVDQVIKIHKDSPHPVRGVVFMGMGEPFLNYPRVMEAASVFSDPCGLGIEAKAVTVSTVGIVPMIRRFTREKRRQRLIVSLTSAIPEKRNQLLPMNEVYPMEDIVSAMRDYQAQRNRRVTFAWTMISGVNMGRDEARALAALTKDMRIILDLIPVNDSTGRFKRPEEEEYRDFLRILNEEVKCPIVRRYSGGADVNAACGMLAATKNPTTI